MQFKGSKEYVSTDDLSIAVNAAINLEKPLLVKGEPGTGKTELARQIASSLKLEIIEWSIKSTTKAQQGLYEYDAVSRLRDSQLGEEIKDISKLCKFSIVMAYYNRKPQLINTLKQFNTYYTGYNLEVIIIDDYSDINHRIEVDDLINFDLFTVNEKNYLFKYHLEVYSKISKYLNPNEKKWLASFI